MTCVKTRFAATSLMAAILLLACANAYGQRPIALSAEGPERKVRAAAPGPQLRGPTIPDAFSAQNTFVLESLGEDDVIQDDGACGPATVGRVYEVDIRPESFGRWSDLPSGGRLWTFSIQSPNAARLRICFKLPSSRSDGELILYDAFDATEVYGPFRFSRARSDGTYWAPTVFSNEVRVEYYIPAETLVDPSELKIAVTSVAQLFPLDEASLLQDCDIDIACAPAWSDEARAVVLYEWPEGTSIYQCTGAIINRIPGDFARIMLTAAHCINDNANAAVIEVYWFYETPTCGGSWPDMEDFSRSDGAVLLAKDEAPDNSVLGLLDTIPSNVLWAGWSANPIPDPTNGTLIHHPSWRPKMISYGVFEGRDDNQCEDPIDYTYRFDLSSGGQMGGSSGGPVFGNSARLIRAVVSCSEIGCTSDENAWEGSFPLAYVILEPFLDTQDNVYVDIASGGGGIGTPAYPWGSIYKGYYGVNGGGTVHIEAGNYPAPITLGWGSYRTVILEGRNGTVVMGE